MRGQCGIAVVAATLATGKGSSTPAAPRETGVAPPRVSLRQKPKGSPPPSLLEAGRRKSGASSADSGRDAESALRVLPRDWGVRREEESSCADTTPCSQPPSSGRSAAKPRRRRRRAGFMPPDAAADGAATVAGPGTACPGGASSGGGRGTATPTNDMHTAGPLLVRGGGGKGGWFGRSGDYDEFPPDFDYGPMDDDDDDDDSSAEDSSVDFCWPEDDEQSIGSAAPATPEQEENGSEVSRLDLKDSLEEEDVLMREEPSRQQGRSRPDRKMMPAAGFGQSGRVAEGRPAGASAVRKSPPRWPASAEDSGSFASSSPLTAATAATAAAPKRVVARANGDGDWRSHVGLPQRSVLGAVLGALAGAVGLKLWEGLVQRRGGGGGGGGRSAAKAEVERGEAGEMIEKAEAETAVAEEEAMGVQQAKIQALEDQLAYLEEDRRRVLLAAKEARSNRRKDDRQLKEYVHTLEVHLDQLSKEKQESEASMLETVRAETAKALEQAQEANQATAAKAAAEVQRARTELEATQALLEEALQEKAAAVQEKAAGDALLRTEQGRGAALEKEVERLRESTVALTQRLLDTVAEAERADNDEREALQAKADEEAEAAVAAAVAAAREEETARCRKEMEAALAEEKEKLRKQMEARVATMRAGLKRRLQEARAGRAGSASGAAAATAAAERPASGVGSGSRK